MRHIATHSKYKNLIGIFLFHKDLPPYPTMILYSNYGAYPQLVLVNIYAKHVFKLKKSVDIFAKIPVASIGKDDYNITTCYFLYQFKCRI